MSIFPEKFPIGLSFELHNAILRNRTVDYNNEKYVCARRGVATTYNFEKPF